MSRDRTYRAVIRGLRVVFAALGLRIDLRGAEHLPTQGGAVVAANHTGYLDFALVGYVGAERGRHVRFLAKSGIFENRISGWAMRAMGHVPVDRVQGAGALRQATRLAAAGEVVGVFSEGTISRSWLVKPLAPGVAAMAIAAGVPLVPMVTFGGHRLLTVDRMGDLRRRTPVSIRVGAPLHPAPGEDAHALTLRLHDRLDELVEETIEEYPRTGHDGAWWLPARWGGSAPRLEDAARLDADGLARMAARRRRKALS
ncbi:lysophospholipid acyltransferase family protein [Nocardioides sp. InS609-2]|uniref:lysophospholipid acyltransferase family protein n=1 Tax=Nocardioides sp. InS609-2 TaxID=2760705 RepID=UPI0020BF1D90|nr:lysophospholipid acyltransferase family protein [Nocardioides sp. InS609-2]